MSHWPTLLAIRQLNDSSPILAVSWLLYIVAGRLVMRRLAGDLRELILAFLNISGVFYFFYVYGNSYSNRDFRWLVCYIMIVIGQYVILGLCADYKGWPRWPAFFAPLVVLAFFRYLPDPDFIALSRFFGIDLAGRPASVIGTSYLAFRCSRLAVEVQNGSVKRPGLMQYLNFAFFLPTMSVGPINTYANFRRGFEATPWDVPVGRAALRVLVGLVKFQFLSVACNQLAYQTFLRDGHLHPWPDLPLTMVFYYLYLYCNFSGFCDMAIGAAALIGIPVPENFADPFGARNIKEFWNRWHITLSQWMRDIVFAPLSKFLVRLVGPPLANHAIAVAITIVFLLVGVWHGVGWNYLVFGAVHALGLVLNHYYTITLKKWLGRDGFKAYMENRWVHGTAVVVTFAYCAASFLFFANTLPQIGEIFKILH